MKKETSVKISLTGEEFSKLREIIKAKDQFEKIFSYSKTGLSRFESVACPRIRLIKKSDGSENLILEVVGEASTKYFESDKIGIQTVPSVIESMRNLLKILGFPKEIILERQRRGEVEDGLAMYIDYLPFGYFLVLEGMPNQVQSAAEKLGFGKHKKITSSYWRVWREYCRLNEINEENCLFG